MTMNQVRQQVGFLDLAGVSGGFIRSPSDAFDDHHVHVGRARSHVARRFVLG
jgi:hypothetical protein